MEIVLSDEVNRDSVQYYMGDFICFDRFSAKTSAFEVLKSKGLYTIQHKELRKLITTFYDSDIQQVKDALADIELEFERSSLFDPVA